jgi:hypothetical protein
MVAIITQGLGSGNLITQGYGFWAKVKEAVKEAISRLIPRRRKRVTLRVPVHGSPVHPFQMTVKVEAEKDFFPLMWELVLDSEDEEGEE